MPQRMCELRQRLQTPATLRSVQLALNVFRGHPLITAAQEQRIKPFFIIGSGRSGTTLLRKLLSRHSAIVIPPEAYGLVSSIKKFIRYRGMDWKDLVNLVFGEFYSEPSFDYWETAIFPHARPSYDCPRPERSLAFLIDRIYRAYLEQHKPGAVIWGDKTPYNTLRLKWVDRVFPQARYIHLLRDGRDVVSSYMRSGLIPDLDDACARWEQSVSAARRFESSKNRKGAARVVTVRYEDLVHDAASVMPTVCRFLGVGYDAAVLADTDVYLGDDSLAHLRTVSRPIDTQSIGRWKTDLTPEEQIRTHGLITPRLLREGYEVRNAGA